MYTLPNSVPYIDLLPGPFLLLIFIPLLPLALFSLGARPPTGSSLGFLTEELWRTTALLGIAVTVGLCVGVYPGSIQNMTEWLKSGSLNLGSIGISGSKGWLSNTKTAAPIGKRVIRKAKPSFDRIARNHITALRYYFPRQYNPSTPKTSSVLILGVLITLITIVSTGKILQSIYESDSPKRATTNQSSSSRPSEWVTNEYELRKKEGNEKKKETEERYKNQEKELVEKYEKRKKEMGEKYSDYIERKSKERKKDLEMLKRMLERKKLDPVGLDKVPKWYIAPKDDDKSKKTKSEEEKKEEAKKKEERKEEIKAKVKTGATSIGDKIRIALLGKSLAASLKAERPPGSTPAPPPEVVVMEPGTISATPIAAAAVPARGPGWEVSEDPATAAAAASSARKAEALARSLGK